MDNSLFERIFENLLNRKIPPFDLHVHTNWTDGKNSVNEILQAADKIGLINIFFSEHSRRDSANWFLNFKKEVQINNNKFKCKGIVGTEVKVLNFNGDLDISDEIASNSELIMASVHGFPGEKGNISNNTKNFNKNEVIKIEYDLSMAAIENPKTNILGHPFGMSLKRFKVIPPLKFFEELIKKTASEKKVFEINIGYHLNVLELIELCLKNNCLISIGSNAHTIQEVGKINNFLKKEYEKKN